MCTCTCDNNIMITSLKIYNNKYIVFKKIIGRLSLPHIYKNAFVVLKITLNHITFFSHAVSFVMQGNYYTAFWVYKCVHVYKYLYVSMSHCKSYSEHIACSQWK